MSFPISVSSCSHTCLFKDNIPSFHFHFLVRERSQRQLTQLAEFCWEDLFYGAWLHSQHPGTIYTGQDSEKSAPTAEHTWWQEGVVRRPWAFPGVSQVLPLVSDPRTLRRVIPILPGTLTPRDASHHQRKRKSNNGIKPGSPRCMTLAALFGGVPK